MGRNRTKISAKMKPDQTMNNSSRLKDVQPDAVLRIRDIDFRVLSVKQSQGFVRLKLEAAEGGHSTLIGSPTARVSQILPVGDTACTTEGVAAAH